ncbi:MAG: ATP-dependent DNA helicase RecG [Alphaproteobacteria bacterium]|nr:ATP-dependent DNA helicase RecG [Alphaproteobacteria bacterium]
MRPHLLNPLFAAVTSLSGVGPKQDKLLRTLLKREDAPRLLDLLLHLPTHIIDRRARPAIRDAVAGTIVTLDVTVERHRPPENPRSPFLVYAGDGTGIVVLTFFRLHKGHVEKLLPIGERRIVSGLLQIFNGTPQIVHPDHVLEPEALGKLTLVEPVYRLTEGLAAGALRRAIAQALEELPDLPEWIPPKLLEQHHFPSFTEAMRRIHQPREPADIEPDQRYRARLAFDELLAGQLALALIRTKLRQPAGTRNAGDGHLRNRIIDALPYALTPSQATATHQIVEDLQQPLRMLRLLQGDVGSGKTVVALLSVAGVAETGKQAALMAPTEILARQHLRTIAPLAAHAGLRVAILTSRETGGERGQILGDLAAGRIDLLIGTHALIQHDVQFRGLGLAIIDEQHRFGVRERLALAAKGDGVDVLVLSATPIPRTLALTSFGDIDISELRDKPPGRQAIDTRAIPYRRLEEVVDAVGRGLQAGRQIYWITARVEDTDSEEFEDVTPAPARFEVLRQRFGEKVGLVHGQMKATDKDAAMERFARGDTRLLVATTVVEVGTDVPDATIMVIENAERFGLAQLHQLRGRIGRGTQASTCLLLYPESLSETARARLKVILHSNDGFEIAEQDLRLRGSGDLTRMRQSGLPGYHIACADLHADLIAQAHDEAAAIVRGNPRLKGSEGEALRSLLYLHDRSEVTGLLDPG